MTQNLFRMTLIALACAGLTLTACSDKSKDTTDSKDNTASTKSSTGEGEVSIIAWPGYIERGATDPGFDWVTQFEKESGCKVSVKTAGTSDEMVSLMNQGGYDLVTASGDASLRLIAGGKVQAIDIEKVPSFKNIDQRLQNASWHTVDGKHYGVPYQWGPNVLMYNTETFKTAPPSWSVVFEEQELPDGKSNKGRVQAFDGPIYIADAALYLMATKPELGIKDPYELNEDQYQAALGLLRQQRNLIQRYWHDTTVQIEDFAKEGIVASGAWPFQVNQLVAAKQPISSTVPKEGVTGWADTTMMHAEAKHPICAYKWMEWSLNDKTQGDLAAWFGSVPVVQNACKNNPLLGAEGCKVNGIDNFDQVHFWKTPVATCASQNNSCVPYNIWSTDYVAVMGGK